MSIATITHQSGGELIIGSGRFVAPRTPRSHPSRMEKRVVSAGPRSSSAPARERPGIQFRVLPTPQPLMHIEALELDEVTEASYS